MAIAIDVANLGNNALDSSQSTIAFTTGSAVASGGFIVLTITCLSVRTVSSISGGGLTWTKDKEGSNNSTISIWSAQAPSGLASGTTITATFSASSAGGNSIAGTSFTGVATTSPVDTTNGPQSASGTAWATGSMTIAAGSVIVACASDFNNLQTSTPTSPSIEAQDFGAGGFSQTTCYRIEAAGGSFTVAGTWAATTLNNGDIDAVAYKAAAAAVGGATSPVAMRVSPLMLSRYFPKLFGWRQFPPTITAQTIQQALTANDVVGTATIVRQVNKILSAVSTTTATIARQANKTATATSTTTATLVKQVNKILSATSTTTATMVALKVILKTLTATVTTTATIVKQVNKILSATATTTASLIKQVNKTLFATSTITATLTAIKVILKTLTATSTTTASMVRQVGSHLSATTTTTATLLKQVNKKLTATSTTTATLAALKVILKTLTATSTATASMTRQIGFHLTATASSSATVTKRVAHSITATVTATASMVADAFIAGAVVLIKAFGAPGLRGRTGSGPTEGDMDGPKPHGETDSSLHSGDFDQP